MKELAKRTSAECNIQDELSHFRDQLSDIMESSNQTAAAVGALEVSLEMQQLPREFQIFVSPTILINSWRSDHKQSAVYP